jgi:predicted MFS family arabinose efflux permease
LLIYLWYGLAVVLSTLLIARVTRRRRAVVPLQMLVMVALLAAMPAAAGAQAPKAVAIPPTIQTVPEVPGMRFEVPPGSLDTKKAARFSPAAIVEVARKRSRRPLV